jgi:hypothetical protein
VKGGDVCMCPVAGGSRCSRHRARRRRRARRRLCLGWWGREMRMLDLVLGL